MPVSPKKSFTKKIIEQLSELPPRFYSGVKKTGWFHPERPDTKSASRTCPY
jgi:hypothetical protein